MPGFFDIDRWNEILQTIARNRKRSIMTALGVFWGIFMLTVMNGAGSGLSRMFRSQLGDMAVNTILMNPQQTGMAYKGMAKGRTWRMDNDDVEAVRQLPEVLYASAVCWAGSQYCTFGPRKGEYAIMGYTPDFQKIQPQKIPYGRYINEMDMHQNRKVCVIGTQVQKDLFPGIDDPTGQTIKIGASYFKVVGLIVRQSDAMTFSDLERTVILPVSLVQQMYGMGRNIHMLALAGRDDVASKTVERSCRQTIYARHIIAPDDNNALWVMAAAELFSKVQSLFWGIALLTWIVGLGTLFAGIVGISNIMLVLVKERTQEIGVRRALGAPPVAIISQILSESFVLTFTAGILGLTAGVGVLSFIDAVRTAQEADAVTWQISFGSAVTSFLILVGGSLLAGVIPAMRALHIKAVDAIREE